jgi:hypothetical protein
MREFFHIIAALLLFVTAFSCTKGAHERTLFVRQFFFAVGKPHRPMDAKLTGEAAGRYLP